MIEKIVKRATCEEKPQNKNTANADPSEDTRIVVVTLKWSPKLPMKIPPGMEVTLTSERMSVLIVVDAPISWTAYEERYV